MCAVTLFDSPPTSEPAREPVPEAVAESASERPSGREPQASGGAVRVRITVAYDGTDFHGFAGRGGGVRTVAGVLGEALGKVLRRPVELTCAGRTDKGVHAWGQVVSFDAP